MTLLQNNLSLIQTVRPALYQFLKPYLNEPALTLIPNSDGTMNVEIDARKLYKQSVADEMQRSLTHSKFKDCRILIFDGVGLGYHVAEAIKKFKSDVLHFVVTEKNPSLFLAALALHDWQDLIRSPEVDFFVGVPERQMVAVFKDYFLQADRLIYAQKLGHFYFMPALEMAGAYYVEFASAAQQALVELSSVVDAHPEDAYRGFMNVMQNLSGFSKHRHIDCLEGFLQGKPAIIVSSGPSLKLHLEKLKNHQNRFFICSSDSALTILLKHGITPQLTFCLERSEVMWKHFRDLPKDLKVPLVTLSSTYAKVFEIYPGPVFLVSRENTFGRWLWPQGCFFNVGNNVAAMATRILTFLKSGSIYFLGQDLAYDRVSRSSHVAGISSETASVEAGRFKTHEYCEIVGNDGTPIPSTIYWKSFLESISTSIAKFGLTCFNVIPQECGAALPNTTRLDPNEFWDKIAPSVAVENHSKDINTVLESLNKTIYSDEYYRDLVTKTLKYLDVLLLALLEHLDVISHTLLMEFPETNDDELLARYQKHFKEWQKRENEIENINADYYRTFLKPIFAPTHYTLLRSREALTVGEHGINIYIFNYTGITQERLKNMCYWALRMKKRLEGISSPKGDECE